MTAPALPYAYVDCTEVQHSPRLLFHRILSQLRGTPIEEQTMHNSVDSFVDFARELRVVIEADGPDGPDGYDSDGVHQVNQVNQVDNQDNQDDNQDGTGAPCGLGDLDVDTTQPGRQWLLAGREQTRFIVRGASDRPGGLEDGSYSL